MSDVHTVDRDAREVGEDVKGMEDATRPRGTLTADMNAQRAAREGLKSSPAATGKRSSISVSLGMQVREDDHQAVIR